MVHSGNSNKKIVQHLLESMIENEEAESTSLSHQKTIKQAKKAMKEEDEQHDEIEFSSDEDDESSAEI